MNHYVVSRKSLKQLYKGEKAVVMIESESDLETKKSTDKSITDYINNLIINNKEKFLTRSKA
jgi:hypothetical protein